MLLIICGLLLSFIIYLLNIQLNFVKKQKVFIFAPWPMFANLVEVIEKDLRFPVWVQVVYNYSKARNNITNDNIHPVLIVRSLDNLKNITSKYESNLIQYTQSTNLSTKATQYAIEPKKPKSLRSKRIVELKQQSTKSNKYTTKIKQQSAEQRPVSTPDLFAFSDNEINSRKIKVYQTTNNNNKNIKTLDCSEYFALYFGENQRQKSKLQMQISQEIVNSCAYGLNKKTLNMKQKRMNMKKDNIQRSRSLNFMEYEKYPKIKNAFHIQLFDAESIDFFRNLVKTVIEFREENNIYRPDMFHLLMKAKDGNLKADCYQFGEYKAEQSIIDPAKSRVIMQKNLIKDDLSVQAIIFFIAGLETISTRLSCISYELALKSDVQRNIQIKIDEVMQRCSYKLTYDIVNNLHCLDIVIKGSRFALLEIKALIVILLSKFDIILIEQRKIPVEVCANLLTLSTENGSIIGFRNRTEKAY